MADSAAPLYAKVGAADGSGGLVRVETGSDLRKQTQQWLSWVETLTSKPYSLPGYRVLKTSEKVEVFEAHSPFAMLGRVVCKQTKYRRDKDSLFGRLRSSPAKRNFHRAKALEAAGIGTPRPVGSIERWTPRASWFITEHLDGIVDLESYVLSVLPRIEQAKRHPTRTALIGALARLFRDLEQARLYHRDMKASNILIGQNKAPPRPMIFLVDLDGLGRRLPWRSRWKPIVRLGASLLDCQAVNQGDYARFLQAYLAARQEGRHLWRVHFRRLASQARAYAKAAQSRKAVKLDGYGG